MGLGKSNIDYMLRVQGISQRMHSIIMYSIIPLFAIVSLDHDCYPGVKIHNLAGDATLVNFRLLDLSGVLSSEDTRQQYLGLPIFPPPTAANRVSNTPMKTPPTGRPTPHPTQPPAQTSAVDYPPPRGVPWKCITAMMRDENSCPVFHFNKPDDSPRLNFHQ